MQTIRAVAAVAVLAAIGAPALAQDNERALYDAARRVVDATTTWRATQNSTPCVWSETLHVILDEQLRYLVANGYTAGVPPQGLTRAPHRARKLHGLKAEIFDNYSVGNADGGFDPAGIVAEQAAHPLIKKLGAPEMRLAAAAVRPAAGRWVVLLAVMSGAPDEVERTRADLAPLAAAARGEDKGARHKAVSDLGGKKHVEALPALREAARHADSETRFLAAHALVLMRTRGAIPPLIAALGDADGIVRSTSAEGLQALTGRKDLGSDPAKWTEWWAAAIETFVMPGEGETPQDLTPVSGGDAPTEAMTLDSLLEMWNKACATKDPLRKVAVLESLREHAERATPKAQAIMKSGLGDAESVVRLEACRAVAAQRMKSAVQPLAMMADKYDGKDNETAKLALRALAQIGDLSGLKAFTGSAWESKDRDVLVTRIFAIRYMRSPESVDWLVSLLTAGRGRRGGFGGGGGRELNESLEVLTGESFRDPDEWRKWWSDHKSRFRPEPLAPDYEVPGLFPNEGGGKGKGQGQGPPPGGQGKGGDKGK